VMWEPTQFNFTLFEQEEEQPQYCAFSRQFQAWALDLVRDTLTEVSHIKIAQAKVMLLDKYYEWKATIPKRHARRHLCIADVMDEAYNTLKQAELALTPPQIYLPEPPLKSKRRKEAPPSPPARYDSVLGEYDD
jgi:hypothetical protein